VTDDGGPTGLEFPCRFPIKVMGEDVGGFEETVSEIVRRHAGALPPERIGRRHSRTGRYLSLTFEITATSRTQLDALYRELSSCGQVAVVL